MTLNTQSIACGKHPLQFADAVPRKARGMTRENYWLIANALAALPNTDLKYETVLRLCKVLKADNPKFDTERFLDACEGK
jgi:hypothetical protein